MVSLPTTKCDNPDVAFSWEYNLHGEQGARISLEAVVGKTPEKDWVARGTYYVLPSDITFPAVEFPTSRHQVYVGPKDIVVDNVQLGEQPHELPGAKPPIQPEVTGSGGASPK